MQTKTEYRERQTYDEKVIKSICDLFTEHYMEMRPIGYGQLFDYFVKKHEISDVNEQRDIGASALWDFIRFMQKDSLFPTFYLPCSEAPKLWKNKCVTYDILLGFLDKNNVDSYIEYLVDTDADFFEVKTVGNARAFLI